MHFRVVTPESRIHGALISEPATWNRLRTNAAVDDAKLTPMAYQKTRPQISHHVENIAAQRM